MKIAILGNTGYLGQEAEKLLSLREDIEIVYTASSKKTKGKLENAEIAILALPHQRSMEMVPQILSLMKFGVIDLSGAYRLKNSKLYPKYYGWEHQNSSLLELSVYGLPEKNREVIKKAKLIASPGCYETAVILGLMPLIPYGLIAIRIDALSGFTGAGKEVKIPTSPTPYKSGRQHQHIPAMEQELGISEKITFFPKIAPFPRGILATIYAKLEDSINTKELKGVYAGFYDKEPFVRVKADVNIDDVVKTNFCDIACQLLDSWIKISVVTDNLGKGGSGQAIQILNIKLGLPETKGFL